MPIQPFQTRLVPIAPTKYHPVRVGPYVVTIEGPPYNEEGRPETRMRPATDYTHFTVHVPQFARAHVWAKWADARGSADIPIRHYVSAEQVQELLDWLANTEGQEEERKASIERLLKRSGY